MLFIKYIWYHYFHSFLFWFPRFLHPLGPKVLTLKNVTPSWPSRSAHGRSTTSIKRSTNFRWQFGLSFSVKAKFPVKSRWHFFTGISNIAQVTIFSGISCLMRLTILTGISSLVRVAFPVYSDDNIGWDFLLSSGDNFFWVFLFSSDDNFDWDFLFSSDDNFYS